VKDASSLLQTVNFSTTRTVIRHCCARKWSETAKPAVPQAMYVKTNKDKDLTPAERTLLSRLHAGGHGPDLAWYQSLVTRNHDQPESAKCQRCVQADETMTDTRDDGLHSTTRCTEQSFQ